MLILIISSLDKALLCANNASGASAGTTFLVQGVEVMMPDFASTPTTPASELVKTLRNKLRDAGHESASLVELPESMLANEEWLAMALKHLSPAAQAAANVRVQCGHRGSGDPHAGGAPPSSNNPAHAAGHLQPRVLRFGTGAAHTLAPDAAQLAADVERDTSSQPNTPPSRPQVEEDRRLGDSSQNFF